MDLLADALKVVATYGQSAYAYAGRLANNVPEVSA